MRRKARRTGTTPDTVAYAPRTRVSPMFIKDWLGPDSLPTVHSTLTAPPIRSCTAGNRRKVAVDGGGSGNRRQCWRRRLDVSRRDLDSSGPSTDWRRATRGSFRCCNCSVSTNPYGSDKTGRKCASWAVKHRHHPTHDFRQHLRPDYRGEWDLGPSGNRRGQPCRLGLPSIDRVSLPGLKDFFAANGAEWCLPRFCFASTPKKRQSHASS